MARRNDGRIEPGQKLSTAISARAWNRAQDAADLVLGQRTDFGANGSQAFPNSIVVRIPPSFPRISEEPLKAGQGVALPVQTFGRLLTEAQNTNTENAFVDDENDLPMVSPQTVPVIRLDQSTSTIGARCGVIVSVSALRDGFYTCRVVVRGIVRCRVLMLQQATSVTAPPPFPTNTNLQPFWRRYLTSSDYGYGSILGVGSVYRLNGENTYPCVAECAVLLG
jgi:hypothetical protein